MKQSKLQEEERCGLVLTCVPGLRESQLCGWCMRRRFWVDPARPCPIPAPESQQEQQVRARSAHPTRGIIKEPPLEPPSPEPGWPPAPVPPAGLLPLPAAP